MNLFFMTNRTPRAATEQQLPPIYFDPFKKPYFTVPKSAKELHYSPFLDSNESDGIMELYRKNILDHLSNLEFVTTNGESLTATEYMKSTYGIVQRIKCYSILDIARLLLGIWIVFLTLMNI
jgi:hypothetical protein